MKYFFYFKSIPSEEANLHKFDTLKVYKELKTLTFNIYTYDTFWQTSMVLGRFDHNSYLDLAYRNDMVKAFRNGRCSKVKILDSFFLKF